MRYAENLINIKQRGRGPIILRKYRRKYGRIGASYTDNLRRRLEALREGESLVTLIYPTCAQRSGFSSECDVVGGFRQVSEDTVTPLICDPRSQNPIGSSDPRSLDPRIQ